MLTLKSSANLTQSVLCIKGMLKVNQPIKQWLITPNVTNNPQKYLNLIQTFTKLSLASHSHNWPITPSLKDYSQTAKVFWCNHQAWWRLAKILTKSNNSQTDSELWAVLCTWASLVPGITSYQRVTSTAPSKFSRIWKTKNVLL